MPHELEIRYGLSAEELLDALNKRFRARVALEGAVAEVHLEKKLKSLFEKKTLNQYKHYDLDGFPDFEIRLPSLSDPLKIECKNVRDSEEAYKQAGKIVAYKVETQKTRASKGDKSSRFYDFHHFDILAVCLGKKTNDWQNFLFCRAVDLKRNKTFPNKLAVMHPVPLPDSKDLLFWFSDLTDLLRTHYQHSAR